MLIAALLLLMFALVFTASLNDAPTIDEPIYITSGYLYLRDGDFTLNLEHPPLIKEILALPLAFHELNFSQQPEGTTFYTGQNRYAHAFLYDMGNPADTMLQVSRFPAYLMLMALGLLIYSWGKRVFGYRAGLVSLFFYVLTPVFLGNGQLAILDLGATLFLAAALYSFYLLEEGFTARRFLAAAFLCAAALVSRFDMIILGLLLPLLALARPFFFFGKEERERRSRECLTGLGRSLAVLATAFLIVLVYFGMHTSNLTREQQEMNIRTNLNPNSSFAEPLREVNEMSPPLAHYLLGVAHDYEFVEHNQRSYWNGYFSTEWRWYYYPFDFLLKTPIATLLLFVAGLVFCLRRFRRWKSSYLLISLGILFLYIESSNIQLGLRHVMSLYPLVLLITGAGGAALLRWSRGGRYRAFTMAGLMTYAAISVLLFYPHFMPYSNEFIIHKDQAYRFLIDSDLDIGQDLRRLADYVEEKGITGLKVDYIGGGEEMYYLPPDTIDWADRGEIPHGWFALSFTMRQSTYWESDEDLTLSPRYYSEWIEEYQPVDVIGHSILIYFIP